MNIKVKKIINIKNVENINSIKKSTSDPLWKLVIPHNIGISVYYTNILRPAIVSQSFYEYEY